MRNRFAFQPRYFLFWLVYFVVTKAAFLLYHFSKAASLPAGSIARIFGYGLRLDASATAYLSLVPFLVFAVGSTLPPRWFPRRVMNFYTAVMGVVVAFFAVVDLELYRAWGFRLDATPLQYLNSPGEMAASAGSAPLFLLGSTLVVLLGLGWWLYAKIVGSIPELPPRFGRLRALLASGLYLALLVVPVRGGLQQIPINQSDVYFSTVPFANHAALNAPWNVVNALLLTTAGPNPYQFMPDSVATRAVRELYQPAIQQPDSATTRLLRTPRPNVLFIILESFTGKFVASIGGEPGVTPNLDSLARTGVQFTNIYAAGDRSQKGLVALLSGYPSQPTTSIIKYPRKTEQLPHLCRSLEQAGYRSHYYYGGELSFANMKSYLVAAGYDQFTERADFPIGQQNSKWGAQDHVVFDRVLQDLKTQPTPFFVTAFTLSSHEPFEIPIAPKFKGSDETALFRNSVYYADWALGRFLRTARQQPWWDNTLLVVVADHGHTLPGNDPNESPAKFRIPLLLAGGALRPAARGRVIDAVGSQTDVAATLLRQLALPATGYTWSHDLLQPLRQPFAFYCFSDGFGMVTPAGTVSYDNVPRRIITQDSAVPKEQLRLGQAYEQVSFGEFLRK